MEFSRTTVSHRSRDSIQTKRHVSERLGDIPPENFDNEHHEWQKGNGVRTDGAVDDNKAHHDREKSIDGPRRPTIDLTDKLRRRDGEKASAKEPKERDSERTKTDEHGKPPCPGFGRQLKDLGVSPFTSHIINTPPESTFHLPKFTKFDPATCEAYTHLIHFRQTIELCTQKDKVKCKAFPSSLGSLGLQWFNKLPAGSIRNLADLERAFNTHFITSNKTAKEPESLSQMRKLPSETLRQYAEHYWQLFNEILDIDEYCAARTFKKGLETGSKILDELAICPPHGMGELMHVVECFCALKEFYADRAAQGMPKLYCNPALCHPQLPAPVIAQQPQTKKYLNNIKEGKKRQPKVHDYVAETTYFKEPIWSFLKEIMRQPWFEWPTGKLGTDTGQPDQNPRKKCSYHNELGHYMTACAPYKALLERLATQDHLDQYIDQTKTLARQPIGNPNPNE
ncbi:hypothetical protein RHMOL_Rhmol11G0019900 [Rhododendron molle]|uniref:Uncharacterized protein n=1 Tax=Rhododendron molle TaxID=49168 RepID=A0ACC0LMJ7_RHOML|nr:hypothetical protein RHMOL_Rhmol11G0019900 [Rhododendron molle]